MVISQVTVLASLDMIPVAAHIAAVDDLAPPGLLAPPAPDLALAAGFGGDIPAGNLNRVAAVPVSIVAGSIEPVDVEWPVFLLGKLA